MQNQNTKEAALLNDLRLGLPEAVEVWYRTYQSSILRYVSQKLENKKDAEEITRETFLNALRDLPLFQGKSSLKTWMLRIASHEVADYYRRRYAKKFIHSIPLSNFLFQEDPKNMHDTSAYVVEVLKRMKAEYKQLIILKYVDNLSVKEISNTVHKSIKSVESDLFRARKEFRMLYEQVSGAAAQLWKKPKTTFYIRSSKLLKNNLASRTLVFFLDSFTLSTQLSAKNLGKA